MQNAEALKNAGARKRYVAAYVIHTIPFRPLSGTLGATKESCSRSPLRVCDERKTSMKGKPVHHPAVRADAPVVPSSKRLPRLQNRHLIVMVVLAAFLMAACASEPATTSEATATAPSVATSTPLPAPTATPTPDLHQPYSAHTPGPGCHQGGAHWSNPSESYGTVECSSDGTEFTAVTASY